MIDQSVRGDEKLIVEGSATMEAEGEASGLCGSMVEIEKNDMHEHSEPSMEILMEGTVTLRAEEKDGSISWVVEMETMIEASLSAEKERWKKVSIYRAPEWHKNISNRKAYQPSLVSLGPFHHGEPDLLPMEEHKRRAVMHFVKRAGRPLEEFVAAIEKVADKLLDAYQGLDDKWRGEKRDRFVEMMVTDGCFFLEMWRTDRLTRGLLTREDGAENDYGANDPVFGEHGFYYLFPVILSDMVVIENQLPLVALERLITVQRRTPLTSLEINNMVHDLVHPIRWGPCPGMETLCLHPLDIYHNSFCGGDRQHKKSDKMDIIIPTAIELSEAGVHFKTSETPWVHDINFDDGVITMPKVIVDDNTERVFLNLILFEQLHADAGRNVTNYVMFMDNIIDSERDVALLRSKGIITNLISDKEVADMFNKLGNGATMNTTVELQEVKYKIKAHCAKRRNKWRAFFVQAYLSNPWVFISLVAAVILLVATLLQTIYTVVPFYTKN